MVGATKSHTKLEDPFYTLLPLDTGRDWDPEDIFVTKFTKGGVLIFSTFLGSTGSDRADSVATDTDGSIYIAARTNSSDLLTVLESLDSGTQPPPVQATLGGGVDGVLIKLSPDGQEVLYSTFIGGGAKEFTWGVDVDDQGDMYLV